MTNNELEPSEKREWGGVVVPEQVPSTMNLDLCNQKVVLTADELVQLDNDVAKIHRSRQLAPSLVGIVIK